MIITDIRNLKHDTNQHTYKTETGSQTQRAHLWLPRRVGGRLGLADVIYYNRVDKQHGLITQHRELHSISCDKA